MADGYVSVCIIALHISHFEKRNQIHFQTKGPQNKQAPNEMDHATWIKLTPLGSTILYTLQP